MYTYTHYAYFHNKYMYRSSMAWHTHPYIHRTKCLRFPFFTITWTYYSMLWKFSLVLSLSSWEKIHLSENSIEFSFTCNGSEYLQCFKWKCPIRIAWLNRLRLWECKGEIKFSLFLHQILTEFADNNYENFFFFCVLLFP